MESTLQQQTLGYYSSDIVPDWLRYVYADPAQAHHFPFGAARRHIMESVLDRCQISEGTAWDVGCGGGQLTVALAQRGLRPIALDFSPAMVEQARLNCEAALGANAVPLRQADVLHDDLSDLPRARFVMAMGLIEYFDDPTPFFTRASSWLAPGGTLLVEFRNRLFNTCSANVYTLQEAAQGTLERLLDESARQWKSTPVSAAHLAEYLGALRDVPLDTPVQHTAPPPAPFPVTRHQHTPEEIATVAASAGLRLETCWGMHPHPFVPAVEGMQPVIYNRLAWSLQRFPLNPLVVASCSSLAAVLHRPA